MTADDFTRFSDPLSELMLLVTSRGEILSVNQALIAFVGRPAGELVGSFVHEMVTDAREEVTLFLLSCARSRRLMPGSLQVKNPQGQAVDFRAEGALVVPRSEDQVPLLMVRLVEKSSAISQFVTLNRRIKNLGEEIQRRQRAESELQEANRLKDEFLATLAHELRNPLASVSNAIHLLKMVRGEAHVQEESLELMDRQVSHLSRLIEDLMDISRITHGRLELKKKPVELDTIIQGALEACQARIAPVGHRLITIVPETTVVVNGDETRLVQIVTNLLNNATRYTPTGGEIVLKVEAHDENLVISVRDTGIGIPAPMIARIFDLFVQVDRTIVGARGGLGIGLTLVKTLVELHHGTIEVRSDGPGRGSEFLVTMSIIQAAPSETIVSKSSASDAASLSGRRILVVDDNSDLARTMSRLLAMKGHEIRTAHDGPEALEAADSFRPDLMFLDIGLPGMSGYEVAQEIRTRPWGTTITIVALTGWGQASDRQKSHDAGIDLHQVKPIDMVFLDEILATPRRAAAQTPSVSSGS